MPHRYCGSSDRKGRWGGVVIENEEEQEEGKDGEGGRKKRGKSAAVQLSKSFTCSKTLSGLLGHRIIGYLTPSSFGLKTFFFLCFSFYKCIIWVKWTALVHSYYIKNLTELPMPFPSSSPLLPRPNLSPIFSDPL